jgi:hypothetical protein
MRMNLPIIIYRFTDLLRVLAKKKRRRRRNALRPGLP